MSNDRRGLTSTETARVGLKKLLRSGSVAPAAVLASSELIALVRRESNQPVDDVTAAVDVADAIKRAIETLDQPASARALFGLGAAKVRSLGDRRSAAAEILDLKPESFRIRREPQLLGALARALVVELSSRNVPSTTGMASNADQQLRFCPYHGGFLRLADCFVVSMNRRLNEEARRRDARGSATDETVDNDVDDDIDFDYIPAHVEPQTQTPRDRAVGTGASAGTVGTMVRSQIDGHDRLVLAAPPNVGGPSPFGPERAPILPSPAELAVKHGGARARPARACPVCHHPLPSTIDQGQPHTIAIVGRTAAGKTCTVLALIEGVRQEGPEALGVRSFVPAEVTWRYLLQNDRNIVENFRKGIGPRGTVPANYPPFEFVATLSDGKPTTLLLQDIAGEDLTDPDSRVRHGMTLWADTIIFVYNPEDSPAAGAGGDRDQAQLLNAIRDDLDARGTQDAHLRRYPDPRLLVAFSKPDLLVSVPDVAETACESEVQATVRDLGDDVFIRAADRWHDVQWTFIAPLPPQPGPTGVLDLFRRVLTGHSPDSDH